MLSDLLHDPMLLMIATFVVVRFAFYGILMLMKRN